MGLGILQASCDPLPWTVQFWSLGLDPCIHKKSLLAFESLSFSVSPKWGFACDGLASLGKEGRCGAFLGSMFYEPNVPPASAVGKDGNLEGRCR
jgi:hypothetical protein